MCNWCSGIGTSAISPGTGRKPRRCASLHVDRGHRTAPDRAALFNGALVRYLDFNDSYLAPGETCHPSDNLAPVLAAAEYANRDGKDVLTALAVAYQVQCRLSDVAPVRARGFDHTTQGADAVAAGVSRALGLDAARTAKCHCNWRHRLQWAPRHTYWCALSLEGSCLPEHCTLLRKCDISREARHHGPPRSIRRQQGIQGFHRGPIRDRLGEGRP
jgi:hypothetical protein